MISPLGLLNYCSTILFFRDLFIKANNYKKKLVIFLNEIT